MKSCRHIHLQTSEMCCLVLASFELKFSHICLFIDYMTVTNLICFVFIDFILNHWCVKTCTKILERHQYLAGTRIRNQNSPPQGITEKPMEVYYLDEWFVITPYIAGFYNQQYIDSWSQFYCTVPSAEYWCPNGRNIKGKCYKQLKIFNLELHQDLKKVKLSTRTSVSAYNRESTIMNIFTSLLWFSSRKSCYHGLVDILYVWLPKQNLCIILLVFFDW